MIHGHIYAIVCEPMYVRMVCMYVCGRKFCASRTLYMYMFIYIYIYIHICMILWMYVCDSYATHTRTHTHTHTHTHTPHTHTHAHAHARARAHTHIHTHTRTRTHARTHTHARTRTHTHACTHTQVTIASRLSNAYTTHAALATSIHFTAVTLALKGNPRASRVLATTLRARARNSISCSVSRDFTTGMLVQVRAIVVQKRINMQVVDVVVGDVKRL